MSLCYLDRVLQYSDRKHIGRHGAKEQSEVIMDNSVCKGRTRTGQQKTGQQNSFILDSHVKHTLCNKR